MIPYEELDRALARWKARSQGGVVEPPRAEAASYDATPLPISPDDLGSIPEPMPIATERTGEIDLAELETYED
jgi:hypothetical protein